MIRHRRRREGLFLYEDRGLDLSGLQALIFMQITSCSRRCDMESCWQKLQSEFLAHWNALMRPAKLQEASHTAIILLLQFLICHENSLTRRAIKGRATERATAVIMEMNWDNLVLIFARSREL